MFGASDLLALLPGLAQRRPVFHSEADFQHALAWAAQTANPDLRVRLETRPKPGVHLDMLLVDPVDGLGMSVELKYFTAPWEGDVDGEHFLLARHSAQDLRGYDFVKDIGRVEKTVADGYAHAGLVLCVTNDSWYWRGPKHSRVTNGGAFRLHEGVVLSGSRAWGSTTGVGTMKGRVSQIDLAGTYTLTWDDYSDLPGPRGRFRYLAVPVPQGRRHTANRAVAHPVLPS